MRLFRYAAVLAAVGGVALVATPAQAFFHLWRFSEVFSNDDGTVQFIEMTTTAPSETFATGFATMTIQSTSTGKTFTFNHNLSGSTTNKRILIATSGFETQPGLPTTPPLLTPDYTLATNFMNPAGDTIRFCQNGCVGFGILETRTFASLPTDGVFSLVYPADATAVNSPTNFAGTTGSVNLAPPTSTGDYNGDLIVDAADYTVWRDTFGAAVTPGSGADGDADGMIDDGDYDFWKSRFGDTLSGAGSITAVLVPEPTFAPPALSGILWVALACIRARNSRR